MSRSPVLVGGKGNAVSSLREARSYFPNIIPEFELRFSHERYDDSAFGAARVQTVFVYNILFSNVCPVCLSESLPFDIKCITVRIKRLKLV